MSASGTRERLATVDGVISVAHDYFGIDVTRSTAKKCVLSLPHEKAASDAEIACGFGWMVSPLATSSGPLTYLKSRLLELGNLDTSIVGAEDDSLPFVHKTVGRKTMLAICSVARSKMFRTQKIIFPIDITSLRVAGTFR